MQPLGLNQIREKFLSFFEEKGHLRMPSFPLVPQGDSSLLLINSGMAPLKPYFSGELTPPNVRATTCQKCIRTPDIERVGQTSRHGTFFEMLGNFSFGDYFKREAAAWAWEFCVDVMEIPVDKIYVSVYLDDDETWDIWTKEIGVDPSHMTRLGKADNFWEIGAGPCGPCSEIYFDRGEENGCGDPECKVGCDCDRFVEFWNLVFTQFNNDGQGNYTSLAQKNIDTGMGLERLACIMQGVDNLFEVDTVKSIREHISEITGARYHQDVKTDISLRIMTDHIRSTTMLVCDGVLPSNEGRGYVLRRLLRRAARHGRLLGVTRPFLFEVCRTVIENSCEAYPILREKARHIEQVIRMEEERFEKTIDAGLGLLRDAIQVVRAKSGHLLSGDSAFKLYDTFGFPIDLTLEILNEEGIELDRDAFDERMKNQREKARSARAAMGDRGWTVLDLGLDRDLKTEFTGYQTLTGTGVVLAIASGNERCNRVSEGDQVSVVLDKTPFYAESGGQVADTGRLVSDGAVVQVDNVVRTKDGKYLHIGTMLSGELSDGDTMCAEVDQARRAAIARAHSATHLLQSALRQILGEHVEQAGSLVEPDRLRFDFTHYASVKREQLDEIERLVNNMALTMTAVDVREMPMDEAKALGAMALFGEKYGDFVRVVQMGDLSVELCGGIHLSNTSGIGLFTLISESSVAAGTRRIEARVGLQAYQEAQSMGRLLAALTERFKTQPLELVSHVERHIEELRETNRALEKLRTSQTQDDMEKLLASSRTVAGLKLVTAVRTDAGPDALRVAGDFLKDKEPDIVAVLAGVLGDKLTFLAVCGKNAVARRVRAGDLIREVSKAADGSGGGRPDSAMGGGKDVSKVDEALGLLESLVEKAAQ